MRSHHSVQDPFEAYQERLNAKLNRQDQSEEALAAREAKRAARESDRTTWLGTNLGDKGKRKRVEGDDEDDSAVGKYLQQKKKAAAVASDGAGNAGGAKAPSAMELALGGGGAKKAKKTGGFGDFSGW